MSNQSKFTVKMVPEIHKGKPKQGYYVIKPSGKKVAKCASNRSALIIATALNRFARSGRV